MRRQVIRTFIVLLLTPAVSWAQSFERVQRALKAGDTVRVSEIDGRITTGRVIEVSPSALVVTVRKENPRDGSGRPRFEWAGERTFGAVDVVKVARPGPIWDGAIKGALVGLIPALVLTKSCHDCYGNGPAAATMIGIGAGIGLGIDAAFGPKTLYRAKRQ